MSSEDLARDFVNGDMSVEDFRRNFVQGITTSAYSPMAIQTSSKIILERIGKPDFTIL